MRLVTGLTALFAFSSSALASTWIVDDNGGPGVDFTSITAAVAAAGPGDVILVRPGTYAGFTLTYPAAILGGVGAMVTSIVHVDNLPAGQQATLAGLQLRTPAITNCIAAVTIEDVVAQPA